MGQGNVFTRVYHSVHGKGGGGGVGFPACITGDITGGGFSSGGSVSKGGEGVCIRGGGPKPVIIPDIRLSPTGGNFFCCYSIRDANTAISANFVLTVKNLNQFDGRTERQTYTKTFI